MERFVTDRPPFSWHRALRDLIRCGIVTVRLLARRRIAQPRARVGQVIAFADGTHGRIYRESVVRGARTDDPVLLVVGFRLRWVRGRGHALFRAESLLNTILFIGFPGFVSKLWLAHDEHGLYRGVYQWNRARLADSYVRTLWWPLALVSERRSIHYVVIAGVERDDALSEPLLLHPSDPSAATAWWRIVSTGTASC
jgi:hypothetical protein